MFYFSIESLCQLTTFVIKVMFSVLIVQVPPNNNYTNKLAADIYYVYGFCHGNSNAAVENFAGIIQIEEFLMLSSVY